MSDAAQKKSNGRGYMISGVIFLVLAFVFWGQLTKLEEEGGSVRINRIVAALYTALGKEAACGVVALLGVGLVGRGVFTLGSASKLAAQEKNPEQNEETAV